MAKIVLVGYGHDGRGLGKTTNGYAYVVNDNVRTKDVIQPVATSSAGRKFVTTGMVRARYGENTVKGQEARQKAIANSGEIISAYSGKELGINGVSRSTKSGKLGEYQELTRGGNIAMYKQSHKGQEYTEKAESTYESYDEYVKRLGG